MGKKRGKRDNVSPSVPPRFKLGDHVVFEMGNSMVAAVVVEDRGKLGVGGRRLYGLHYDFMPGDVRYTEMPEEELKPASTP